MRYNNHHIRDFILHFVSLKDMVIIMYNRIPEKFSTDILVIGAGLAGVCAAITAARNGCSVVLLEKFRTLGGNGGPDVGVHPSGAHRFHPYAVETGVMEELIEEAAWRGAKTLTYDHHYNISQQWDTVLSDKLKAAGVTVLRCNYAKTPVVEDNAIKKVIVEDISTYHTREITVNIAVVDSSGDGNVSAEAGAEFRIGREAASTYNERSAPEKADNITLGSSVVGYVRKTSDEVPFVAPDNIPPYYPGYEHSPTRFRPAGESVLIYPTETGGENSADTIEDEHEIYNTLVNQLYAWWERGKREFPENRNWELTWVSPRVAKRESRRFVGAYTLNQNDVEAGKIFDDAIGFGGFAEDLHYPRPENEKYIEINYIAIPPLYSIPYRSVYSKDINNLFFASRLCSVSHLAHGTVRLQRTLSTLGMAVGVAAGLCKKYNCKPADIYEKHLEELQQTMLKQDISVMGKKNTDPLDLAKKAVVTADSYQKFGVNNTDEFLPLENTRTLMLWDWAERLDTFSCFLKNEDNNDKEIKATLRLYNPARKYKENTENKKFSYFNVSNQMEWGVDDTREKFLIVKQVSFTVPAGYEGWCEIPFDAELIEKDEYNDDARYAIELSDTQGVYWSVNHQHYDFCRRAEWNEGEIEYTSYYDGLAFNITPAPLYGNPENVIDGVNRRWSTNPVHAWISGEKKPQSLVLSWEEEVEINKVNITFDTFTRAYSRMPLDSAQKVNPILVKKYTVEAFIGGEWKTLVEKDNNYHRFNTNSFENVKTNKLRINTLEVWNGGESRIYEVRVYKE